MTKPRKKRAPNRSSPRKDGVLLPSGEMTAVVIGTVVRLGRPPEEGGENGATGRRLHKVLASEGYSISLRLAHTWLVKLYNDGRIDRVGRGRYAGM